jgi:hypothetical protein
LFITYRDYFFGYTTPVGAAACEEPTGCLRLPVVGSEDEGSEDEEEIACWIARKTA